MIERSSTELADEGFGRSFRLVHVDGSHQYDVVRQDIATALELLVDGGIVVVETPHGPSCSRGGRSCLAGGHRREPDSVSRDPQKFYACRHGDTETTAEMLRRWALEEAPVGGLRQQVAGHEMVVLAPPLQSPALATELSPEPERPQPENEATGCESASR